MADRGSLVSTTAEFGVVRGRTVAESLRSSYPSKLMTLHTASNRGKQALCWLFWAQFGGGAVCGDALSLTITLKPRSTVLSVTQGALKVYRHLQSRWRTREELATVPTSCAIYAEIQDDALFVHAPDATMLYDRARFMQETILKLNPGASTVVVDWLAAGRVARGENWSFDRFSNEVRIELCNQGEEETSRRVVLRDSLVLDNHLRVSSESARSGPSVEAIMGQFEAIATVYLFGPRLAQAAEEMEQKVADCVTRTFTPYLQRPDTASELASRCLISATQVPRYTRLRSRMYAAARDKARSATSQQKQHAPVADPPRAAALVIRIAAKSSQLVQDALDDILRPLEDLLGAHPYQRRGIS